MRKHHLTLMACLLLAACASDDVSKPSTTTPVKNTPTKKPSGSANPNPSAPVKPRPNVSVPPSAGVPIDGIVIQHRNRGKAQLLAAVDGGVAGADVDDYMAQQAEDLRRLLQSEIEQGEVRVERRTSDNALRVSMTPGSGFDNLSSVVKPGYLASLNKIVPVLNQYGKTMLTVIGYIEHAGADAGNQKLAERRAKSVTDYFVNQNVDALRLQSYARSATPDNGGVNDQPMRRVELWIQPVLAQ